MLNPIDPAAGLWDAQSELSFPGRWRLPLRMSVLRLPDGGLLLHSPIAIDDTLAEALAALGPVRHLVAPNLLHHIHLRKAQARYPEARVWAPPGLAARKPRLRVDAELAAGTPLDWGGALEVLPVAGAPRMTEFLFLHAASGTLICTDLVFNLRTWSGATTGLVLLLFGTRGRFAMSRLVRAVVRDRPAFRASLAPLWGRPFRRIVMSHGAVYESASAPADLRAAIAARLGPE